MHSSQARSVSKHQLAFSVSTGRVCRRLVEFEVTTQATPIQSQQGLAVGVINVQFPLWQEPVTESCAFLQPQLLAEEKLLRSAIGEWRDRHTSCAKMGQDTRRRWHASIYNPPLLRYCFHHPPAAFPAFQTGGRSLRASQDPHRKKITTLPRSQELWSSHCSTACFSKPANLSCLQVPKPGQACP